MDVSPRLRVPVGPDAHRWWTFDAERTLVVAARTVTSTVRALECLPSLVRDDGRISVVFAYDSTSAFSDGVLELLRAAGCRIMPWAQLEEVEPDLILSASENVDVPDGHCPVLVLPHGVGFQKMVPDARGSGVRLSGVTSDALLESGRAWLAVSHPDQERQLLAAHPKSAGRTLLVGDPCFDELVASRGQRAAYRAALGVAEGRRLVMVSSTWGATSLIGQDPNLPARLLAALPYDEYRVGLILHPNVWAAHGSWQVRTLQASAVEAGLTLVPTVHSWRPALLGADLVIGDHGSVTLYAASLGTPVMLGAFGEDAVPGTAASALSRTVRPLDAGRDLHQQVVEALDGSARSPREDVSQHAFSEPGQAHARLRAALYRLIRLEPPRPTAGPPVLDRPQLVPGTVSSPTALRVTTTVAPEPSGWPAVTVRRVPAAVAGAAVHETEERHVHLACREDEEDRCLLESASVVSAAEPAATTTRALDWIAQALGRFPGCLLAATGTADGSVLVGLRDGRIVTAAATGSALAPGLAAATVYALLRASCFSPDTEVALHCGGHSEDLVLRGRPAATGGLR